MSHAFEVPEEIYNELAAHAARYGQTPDELFVALISAALERLKQAHVSVAIHIPSDSLVTDPLVPFVEASYNDETKTEQGESDIEAVADDYREQDGEEEQSRPLTRADIELLRGNVETSAMLNVSSRNLRGIDLSYFDLQGANLRNADLREANLRGANLSQADLRGARLDNADLDGANLSYAFLGENETNRVHLRNTRLSHAILRGLDLRGFDLSELDMQNADLNETDLRGALLHGTNLQGADLSSAKAHWSDLANARLYNMR